MKAKWGDLCITRSLTNEFSDPSRKVRNGKWNKNHGNDQSNQ